MSAETSPLIALHHVSLGYEDKTVLKDVTLTIGSSDTIVLQGPNGGGKTTLLRLLAGLASQQKGDVERRQDLRVGYLPQYRSIDRQFPITVAEVVRSGLTGGKSLFRRFGHADNERTQEMLKEMELEELAQRPIDTLSGGQWQRTLLARALVSQPQLLLLDEPDTHLDASHKEQLYAILQSLRMAIVLVSHDAGVFRFFPQSRHLHIEGGKVME